MRCVSGKKIDNQSLGGESQTVKNVRSHDDGPFVLICEVPVTSRFGRQWQRAKKERVGPVDWPGSRGVMGKVDVRN
jgi:hypothetical protein